MSSSDRMEVRCIIKFCHDLGKTPTQTLKMIEDTKRKDPVSRSLVFKWHQKFAEGEESFKERQGRGRKRKYGATAETSIRQALDADRRLTIRDLAEKFEMGYGTVQRILTDNLHMSKVN